MVQITRSGTIGSDAVSELDRLRILFARHHCVRIARLLEPSLLQFVQRHIEGMPFDDNNDVDARTGQTYAHELSQRRGPAMSLLYLLANDPRFFQVIRAVTGCSPIGCFKGRIYRMIPGQGYFDSWHDDLGDHRMIGMSINLSTEIYSGGVFQMRNARSQDLVEMPNTGFGDAVLFRLADFLEHQVSCITGVYAKTAFAGWFCSQPDFREMLHERAGQP